MKFSKLALIAACLSVGVANAADAIQDGDLNIVGTTFTHLWSNQPQGTKVSLGVRNNSDKALAPKYILNNEGNTNLTLSYELTSKDSLCHDNFIPAHHLCWFTVNATDVVSKDNGTFTVKVTATNPENGKTLIDVHPVHYYVDATE